VNRLWARRDGVEVTNDGVIRFADRVLEALAKAGCPLGSELAAAGSLQSLTAELIDLRHRLSWPNWPERAKVAKSQNDPRTSKGSGPSLHVA
jgi:hypothetical protein